MKDQTDVNYWLKIKDLEEAKKKIISNPNFNETTERDVERIKKYLKINKNDIVLEFGCGIGRLMQPLSKFCKQIVGLDISEAMIDYGLKYCENKNIVFLPMQNETDIKLEKESVDKIYSLLVLQHIEKPKAFRILFELKRILKIGGKVFIQYPDAEQKNYLNYMINRERMGSLTCLLEFYSKKELEMIFKSMGFEEINITKYETDFYITAEKVRP